MERKHKGNLSPTPQNLQPNQLRKKKKNVATHIFAVVNFNAVEIVAHSSVSCRCDCVA